MIVNVVGGQKRNAIVAADLCDAAQMRGVVGAVGTTGGEGKASQKESLMIANCKLQIAKVKLRERSVFRLFNLQFAI